MKGYCVPRDVRLALAPLSQFTDQSTAASLTDEQINDAINEAEGIVDSYVLSRYLIPIVEVTEPDPETPGGELVFEVAPDPIRGLTRNIAAYLSALTFRKNKDLTEDDPIRLRFRLTMDMLAAIRSSIADLPSDVFPPASSDTSGVFVENLYTGTLFHMSDVGLHADYLGRSSAAYLIPADLWRV